MPRRTLRTDPGLEDLSSRAFGYGVDEGDIGVEVGRNAPREPRCLAIVAAARCRRAAAALPAVQIKIAVGGAGMRHGIGDLPERAGHLHVVMGVVLIPARQSEVKLALPHRRCLAENFFEKPNKIGLSPSGRQFDDGVEMEFVSTRAALTHLLRGSGVEVDYAPSLETGVVQTAIEERLHALRASERLHLDDIMDMTVDEESAALPQSAKRRAAMNACCTQSVCRRQSRRDRSSKRTALSR